MEATNDDGYQQQPVSMGIVDQSEPPETFDPAAAILESNDQLRVGTQIFENAREYYREQLPPAELAQFSYYYNLFRSKLEYNNRLLQEATSIDDPATRKEVWAAVRDDLALTGSASMFIQEFARDVIRGGGVMKNVVTEENKGTAAFAQRVLSDANYQLKKSMQAIGSDGRPDNAGVRMYEDIVKSAKEKTKNSQLGFAVNLNGNYIFQVPRDTYIADLNYFRSGLYDKQTNLVYDTMEQDIERENGFIIPRLMRTYQGKMRDRLLPYYVAPVTYAGNATEAKALTKTYIAPLRNELRQIATSGTQEYLTQDDDFVFYEKHEPIKRAALYYIDDYQNEIGDAASFDDKRAAVLAAYIDINIAPKVNDDSFQLMISDPNLSVVDRLVISEGMSALGNVYKNFLQTSPLLAAKEASEKKQQLKLCTLDASDISRQREDDDLSAAYHSKYMRTDKVNYAMPTMNTASRIDVIAKNWSTFFSEAERRFGTSSDYYAALVNPTNSSLRLLTSAQPGQTIADMVKHYRTYPSLLENAMITSANLDPLADDDSYEITRTRKSKLAAYYQQPDDTNIQVTPYALNAFQTAPYFTGGGNVAKDYEEQKQITTQLKYFTNVKLDDADDQYKQQQDTATVFDRNSTLQQVATLPVEADKSQNFIVQPTVTDYNTQQAQLQYYMLQYQYYYYQAIYYTMTQDVAALYQLAQDPNVTLTYMYNGVQRYRALEQVAPDPTLGVTMLQAVRKLLNNELQKYPQYVRRYIEVTQTELPAITEYTGEAFRYGNAMEQYITYWYYVQQDPASNGYDLNQTFATTITQAKNTLAGLLSKEQLQELDADLSNSQRADPREFKTLPVILGGLERFRDRTLALDYKRYYLANEALQLDTQNYGQLSGFVADYVKLRYEANEVLAKNTYVLLDMGAPVVRYISIESLTDQAAQDYIESYNLLRSDAINLQAEDQRIKFSNDQMKYQLKTFGREKQQLITDMRDFISTAALNRKYVTEEQAAELAQLENIINDPAQSSVLFNNYTQLKATIEKLYAVQRSVAENADNLEPTIRTGKNLNSLLERKFDRFVQFADDYESVVWRTRSLLEDHKRRKFIDFTIEPIFGGADLDDVTDAQLLEKYADITELLETKERDRKQTNAARKDRLYQFVSVEQRMSSVMERGLEIERQIAAKIAQLKSNVTSDTRAVVSDELNALREEAKTIYNEDELISLNQRYAAYLDKVERDKLRVVTEIDQFNLQHRRAGDRLELLKEQERKLYKERERVADQTVNIVAKETSIVKIKDGIGTNKEIQEAFVAKDYYKYSVLLRDPKNEWLQKFNADFRNLDNAIVTIEQTDRRTRTNMQALDDLKQLLKTRFPQGFEEGLKTYAISTLDLDTARSGTLRPATESFKYARDTLMRTLQQYAVLAIKERQEGEDEEAHAKSTNAAVEEVRKTVLTMNELHKDVELLRTVDDSMLLLQNSGTAAKAILDVNNKTSQAIKIYQHVASIGSEMMAIANNFERGRVSQESSYQLQGRTTKIYTDLAKLQQELRTVSDKNLQVAYELEAGSKIAEYVDGLFDRMAEGRSTADLNALRRARNNNGEKLHMMMQYIMATSTKNLLSGRTAFSRYSSEEYMNTVFAKMRENGVNFDNDYELIAKDLGDFFAQNFNNFRDTFVEKLADLTDGRFSAIFKEADADALGNAMKSANYAQTFVQSLVNRRPLNYMNVLDTDHYRVLDAVAIQGQELSDELQTAIRSRTPVVPKTAAEIREQTRKAQDSRFSTRLGDSSYVPPGGEGYMRLLTKAKLYSELSGMPKPLLKEKAVENDRERYQYLRLLQTYNIESGNPDDEVYRKDRHKDLLQAMLYQYMPFAKEKNGNRRMVLDGDQVQLDPTKTLSEYPDKVAAVKFALAFREKQTELLGLVTAPIYQKVKQGIRVTREDAILLTALDNLNAEVFRFIPAALKMPEIAKQLNEYATDDRYKEDAKMMTENVDGMQDYLNNELQVSTQWLQTKKREYLEAGRANIYNNLQVLDEVREFIRQATEGKTDDDVRIEYNKKVEELNERGMQHIYRLAQQKGLGSFLQEDSQSRDFVKQSTRNMMPQFYRGRTDQQQQNYNQYQQGKPFMAYPDSAAVRTGQPGEDRISDQAFAKTPLTAGKFTKEDVIFLQRLVKQDAELMIRDEKDNMLRSLTREEKRRMVKLLVYMVLAIYYVTIKKLSTIKRGEVQKELETKYSKENAPQAKLIEMVNRLASKIQADENGQGKATEQYPSTGSNYYYYY